MISTSNTFETYVMRSAVTKKKAELHGQQYISHVQTTNCYVSDIFRAIVRSTRFYTLFPLSFFFFSLR